MKLKWHPPWVLHPFLVASFPVVFMYANNIWQMAFADVWRALVVSLLLALGLLVALSLVTKDVLRGAVLATLTLFFFVSYGHAFNLISVFYRLPLLQPGLHWRLLPVWAALLAVAGALFVYGGTYVTQNGQHARGVRPAMGVVFGLWLSLSMIFFPLWWNWYLLPLWGLLAAAAIYATARRQGSLHTLHATLNWVAGILILFSVFRIASFAIESGSPEREVLTLLGPEAEIQAKTDAPESMPDIYYIVLDSYARNDSLLDHFGYDNSEFVDALRERGFYVATESCTNYPSTFLSLPSSLNMALLDEAIAEPRDSIRLRNFYELIQGNRLTRTLREMGYRYVHLPSHWGPTDRSTLADVSFDTSAYPSDFEMTVLKSTMLHPAVAVFRAVEWRQVTLDNLERLRSVSGINEPTFTFAHLIVPHAPYVFDRSDGMAAPNGTPVDGTIVDEEAYAANSRYIDQMVFVNRETIAIVDEILTQSSRPPIVIIQSDHGHWPAGVNSSVQEQTHFESMRLPILNAYLLPDGGNEHLYPTITPVNSFRVVLDTYFGTELGLLPDRSYYQETPDEAPYDLSELDCNP